MSSRHPFDVTPICAYRQPPNLVGILVKSKLLDTVTSTGYKKHEKPKYLVSNIITTDSGINIPGTSHIFHLGNYNCDSLNIVYLFVCNYGNYVCKTSIKCRLRMNNHKKAFKTTTKVCGWLYIAIMRTIPSMTFHVLY